MRFKALLFDIDGTLLRAGGAGKAALSRAMQELFAIEKPHLDITFGGRTDLSIARELFDKHAIAWSLQRAKQFLETYADYFHQGLEQHQPEILPGVRPLLKALTADKRYSLGLLTGNIEVCARHKLAHFDLWDYFDHGGFGDHHEERSGIAASAFAHASDRHAQQLLPEQALVIGDTPADIACARAIGAKVLAVGTGHVDRKALLQCRPDFFLEDLGDFEAFQDLLEISPRNADTGRS